MRFLRARRFSVGDAEPVGPQAPVRLPDGGRVVDEEARAALREVYGVLEAFGLVAAPGPASPPSSAPAGEEAEAAAPRPPRRARHARDS